MSYGKKQEKNGQNRIQLVMKDIGIVLWEVDTLQKIPSLLTMTNQGVEIRLADMTYQISILCVPSTIEEKDQEGYKNTLNGSNNKTILHQFFDVIKEDIDKNKH